MRTIVADWPALPRRRSPVASAGAQQTVKIGVILPYSGQFADPGGADRQRHQALHAAARRHRRRQEDRDHPQGHRRHRARRRQAAGAGTGRARQGRYPRRLLAHAQCARGRRRLGAGEEVHGGDERGDLDHHDQVALHGAGVVHAAAAATSTLGTWAYKNGVRKVYTMVADFGRRPRRRGRVPAGASRRPAARSSARCAIPVANPDFSAFVQRAKDVNPEAIFIWMPGRRAAGGDRQGARRARHRSDARPRCSAQGELTDEQALKSMGDAALGIITAVATTTTITTPGANKEFVAAYNDGVQAQSGLVLRRRLRRHAPDLRGAQEDRRQDRRRGADRGRQGNGVGEPARPDVDRSGDPRRGADRLYPPGREGRRRAASMSSSTRSRTSRIRSRPDEE